MPHEWNNIIVVTKEELIPSWFNTWSSLKATLHRYSQKPYGIKRVQLGGNGRQLLIAFDSLPEHIQNGLGDPRKVNHILERFYKIDGEAVSFFATYVFPDGTYLDEKYQERYIINASVIGDIAIITDIEYPERNGSYLIESVNIQHGINGFRRVITPERRLA